MINYPHLARSGVRCAALRARCWQGQSLLMPRMLGNQIKVMAADGAHRWAGTQSRLRHGANHQYRVEGLAVIPLHGILWHGMMHR